MKGQICFSGRSLRKIHQNFAKTIEYERLRRLGIDPGKPTNKQKKQVK